MIHYIYIYVFAFIGTTVVQSVNTTIQTITTTQYIVQKIVIISILTVFSKL